MGGRQQLADGRDTWPQRGADAARAVYLCIVTSVGRVRDRKLGAQVERLALAARGL
jgi:hypothetical protein